jgi:hypothetical protein
LDEDKRNRVYIEALAKSETVVVKVSARALQEQHKVNQAFISKNNLTQGHNHGKH